jgi:SAM-dependent methyltransferase
LPAVSIVKTELRKLMAWYLRSIAQQVSVFATATVGALKLLGRRVAVLEASTPGADPAVREQLTRAATVPDFTDVATTVSTLFASTTGRVLVGECGDGTLVQQLRAAGADAYGCDPRLALVEQATLQGVEVRADDLFDHLGAVDHEALSGLVLAGVVDREPVGRQLALADLASTVLASGGRVAIVGAQPDAWGRTTSIIDADLSPGKPLHAETWVHLLEERGFRGVERTDAGATRYVVTGVSER